MFSFSAWTSNILTLGHLHGLYSLIFANLFNYNTLVIAKFSLISASASFFSHYPAFLCIVLPYQSDFFLISQVLCSFLFVSCILDLWFNSVFLRIILLYLFNITFPLSLLQLFIFMSIFLPCLDKLCFLKYSTVFYGSCFLVGWQG